MLRKCEQSGQSKRGTSPGEACPGTSTSVRVTGIYARGELESWSWKLELGYTRAAQAGS